MTEQLLFIDNKAMDINESTNITLNFRSNIFSDVSKITSNNTYSIKLPLTVNNCHVINYAHLPSHSAQYARINHKGRYLRNGIEIIPDASVILIEISETIDIAMTWGNVSKFAEIVNDNKTLQDLSYGRTENEDYIIWKKGDNSPRIPKIDYGFKNDEPAAWYHPVVTAMWVLNKIEADADITFKFQEQHICYPSGTSVSGVTYYNDDSFISSDNNAIGTSNGEKRELDITIPEGVNQLYICGLIGKNLVHNVKREYINAEKLQKDIEEIRQKLNLTKNGVSVLTGKTLVILGDSSCSVGNIENNTGEKTSWAYRAHELGNIYGFNVFIYAVSGSGWSKTPNSENVMYQWEQAKAQLQSINCEDPVIIITTGGNELNKLLLNYDEAIELCESDTTSLQNAGEYAVQTLKNILEDCPKASVYLVANFYAGSSNAKNRNRRIYRNFLNAMSDFFTCSLIDLSKNAQIRGYQENDVNSNGYHLFTSDGIHAYNIDGQKRICRIILGRLVADFTIEFLE